MRKTRHFTLAFLLLNAAICLVVFNDALVGRSLLAPLDIAPAMFGKYRFVDPEAGMVPANHFIMDQLTYDLPIQRTIYQAYARGEIPWWDPFTFGGRPLLADAHINGTDPVRLLLYRLLPFELAYNWTKVLHFFLSGTAMFFLLTRFGFSPWICCAFGLTFEFASFNSLVFGHPWLQASFLYYPLLWGLWDAEFAERSIWRVPLAGLVVAGIFYAGNLQSHAYLPIFGLAILTGYGAFSPGNWKRFLPIVILSICLGGSLAAPVLLNEAEFYVLGTRLIIPLPGTLPYLKGVASISGVFPWMIGTFRTLDAGKVFGLSSLGFMVYVGSAGFILALEGASKWRGAELSQARTRTAILLVGAYFLVLSTPLYNLLYSRVAGLAVTGLVVLAAGGVEKLLTVAALPRKRGRTLVIFACLTGLAVNIGGLVIYPAVKPRVRNFILVYEKSHSQADLSTALRDFQIENLPNEMTFKNPEVLLAWLGLLAVGLVFFTPLVRRAQFLQLIAILNLIPLLLFCHRFIPHQPIELWRRLLAGGPVQKEAMVRLQGTHRRLEDDAVRSLDQLVPLAFPHLYGIRTVHGYSALIPKSLYAIDAATRTNYEAQTADLTFVSTGPGTGVWRTNSAPGLVRFEWNGASPRAFEVVDESLNRIQLRFSPGLTGQLLWTDTQYPGWRAAWNGTPLALTPEPPCFSRIAIPPDGGDLILTYRPRFLPLGLGLAGAGLLAGLFMCFRNKERR